MEFSNINQQAENDYRFINDNIDIWPVDNSFPFKKGDVFPPQKLKDRADISYTNKLLYNNEYGDIFNHILSVIPETDMVYAQRIKDIIADLPFFKIVVDSFVSICISNNPIIDSPDLLDQQISDLISRSNLRNVIESIIRSLFLDPIDAYRVTSDLNGDPLIEQIPVKNLIVYNHPQYLSSVCCVLVSNVLIDKVEFIEYWYDGKIVKRVFEYDRGKLGDQLSCEDTLAFGGRFNRSPIVIVKHNTDNINDVYGHDQLSTWDGAVVALCRVFSNMIRLNERVREMIKVVPESSLSILQNGQTAFVNRGVVTYADGLDSNQRPDVKYVIPEIKANIDACKEIMERCIKIISMSTGLAPSWFDPEKTGTNLSGNSLKVSMIPTVLKSKMITNDIESSVKEIICKMANNYGIELNKSQLDMTWFTGIEIDNIEETANVMDLRLSNNTISKEDAIIKMDKVSRRIARERANKLNGISSSNTNVTDIKPIDNDGVGFTNGDIDKSVNSNANDVKTGSSNIVPDYEMPIIPTNLGV